MESAYLQQSLQVIDQLFEAKLQAAPGADVDHLEAHFEQQFLQVFHSEELLDSIPSLSSVYYESLPNGSLVRFRAMVQNMFEPEYYPAVYGSNGKLKCGIYKESYDVKEGESLQFDSASTKTSCRHSLLCVTVPAETAWAKTHHHSRYSAAAKQGSTTEGERSSLKRGHEEEEDNSGPVGMDISPKKPAPERKSRTNAPSQPFPNAPAPVLPAAATQFHPIPSESKSLTCLIKIYGEEHSLKLNEEIEFFGILNYDVANPEGSSVSQADTGMGDPFEEEFLQQQALFSRVPRLQVITSRKIESNGNPLLPRSLSGTSPQIAGRIFNENLATLRTQLLQYIGDFLEGDVVAAEFLLLNLISSIYQRQEDICLGKFSLNISNCPGATVTQARPPTPPSILGNRSADLEGGSGAGEADQKNNEWIEKVAGMISSLVPKFHKISLSLDYLNNTRFIPSKDYQTHVLKSAELQLTEGTVLLLDETAMKEGKLVDQGVKNLQAVHQLVQSQTIQYDFQYYPLQFHMNIPVVIFSEGKSLIPVDFWVPLEPLKLPVPVEAPAYSEEFMNTFRCFLSLLRSREYEISPNMAQEVEQGFARQRQQAHAKGGAKMTQEELFSQLTLARLLAISFGETTLTPKRWAYAQELETRRRSRTAKYHKGTTQPPKF